MMILKGSYILHNLEAKKLVADVELDKDKTLPQLMIYVYSSKDRNSIDSIAVMRDEIVQVTKEDNPEYFL